LPSPNQGVVYNFSAPGMFTIETTLDAHASITIDDLAKLAALPPHWMATIEVSSASTSIEVAMLYGDFVEVGSSHIFELPCTVAGEEGQPENVGLRIRNDLGSAQAVKLMIKPTLTTCE
jgi:hypothetical protein